MTTTPRKDPLAYLDDEVAALKERHLYRALRVMSSAQGPIVSVDDKRLISLSSNDYLGLTHHPRLRDAALAAVRDFGVGSGAVRTIAGTMSMHEALEAELAEFKGTPAVLTFQSGFTANTGVIPTITGETDLIVSDSLNHASIIDGMRLSKAPRKVYAHADVEALKGVLAKRSRTAARGVASRIGRSSSSPTASSRWTATSRHCPGSSRRPRRPARPYSSMTHMRRASSAGTAAARSTTSGCTAASPSRSARCRRRSASLGGYVAGSAGAARDPHPAGAPVPVLDLPPAGRRRRVPRGDPGHAGGAASCIERLWATRGGSRRSSARLGFDTGRSETPITPVMMGDPETAMRFSDRLMGEGVFAQPVVFPTVAIDQARIRTIVTAAHADEQLDRALEAFATVGRELGLVSG